MIFVGIPDLGIFFFWLGNSFLWRVKETIEGLGNLLI